MKTLACIFILICLPASAYALASNQLYTGDPSTVPPGKTQLQLYTDSTYPGRSRIGGVIFTRGITDNIDARFAYSYLWNFNGPNTQIGPNLGLKWRFLGDGYAKPSLAISTLAVLNQNIGGQSRKSDYASTLLASYPLKNVELLFNFGHVWIGDNFPDLRYLGLAAVGRISKYTLTALEYSSLERVDRGGPPVLGNQIAAGIVYGKPNRWIYSFQVGYLPEGVRVKWHTTLGVSTYF